MSNEALDAALAEYEAVGARYVAALEEKGLVFAEEGAGERRRAELRAQLAARGVATGRIYAEPPTLNDVFLEITGKALRD